MSTSAADDGPWVSVDDATLGISIQVPEGWSRTATPVFPLQLLAPAGEGFRASISFSHSPFDPPTPAGLEAWIASTTEAQHRDYEDFEEVERRPLELDHHPGSLQRYRWQPPTLGAVLEQLLVIAVVEPSLLLEVDTARRVDGSITSEVIERVIGTLRFLERSRA